MCTNVVIIYIYDIQNKANVAIVFITLLEIIAKIKKIEEEQRRKFEEDNPD